MEILPTLRFIWRHRLVLGLGVFAAVAALVALGGASPVSRFNGVAWTDVALDTPQSQLAEVAPAGGQTLPWRATLLMHLLSTSAATQEVARRLGVAANQVIVVDNDPATVLVDTATAKAAALAASNGVAPYALTVSANNGSVPLISIEAAAPDGAGAARLAQAAVAVLESQASPAGAFRSPVVTGGNVLQRQPFIVEQVAPVSVKSVLATSLPTKAIGGALFVLVAWCAGGLLLPGLLRWIRGHRGPLAA